MRCLKHYIAREVFHHLTLGATIPTGPQLREARQNTGISLKTLTASLQTWPTSLSALERSITYNTRLALRYQAHLDTP